MVSINEYQSTLENLFIEMLTFVNALDFFYFAFSNNQCTDKVEKASAMSDTLYILTEYARQLRIKMLEIEEFHINIQKI